MPLDKLAWHISTNKSFREQVSMMDIEHFKTQYRHVRRATHQTILNATSHDDIHDIIDKNVYHTAMDPGATRNALNITPGTPTPTTGGNTK